MIEYALLASLTAVAAGLFAPEISADMVRIYSRVESRLIQSGNAGAEVPGD